MRFKLGIVTAVIGVLAVSRDSELANPRAKAAARLRLRWRRRSSRQTPPVSERYGEPDTRGWFRGAMRLERGAG